jgi:hypothetical protein
MQRCSYCSATLYAHDRDIQCQQTLKYISYTFEMDNWTLTFRAAHILVSQAPHILRNSSSTQKLYQAAHTMKISILSFMVWCYQLPWGCNGPIIPLYPPWRWRHRYLHTRLHGITCHSTGIRTVVTKRMSSLATLGTLWLVQWMTVGPLLTD